MKDDERVQPPSSYLRPPVSSLSPVLVNFMLRTTVKIDETSIPPKWKSLNTNLFILVSG